MCQYKEYIKETANQILDKASDIYQESFYDININFSLRGMCAGQYCFNPYKIDKHIINFNLHLCKNNQSEFDQTIAHEIAHYITYKIYGKVKPHGNEWKSVIVKLGFKPKRTHSYKYIRPGRNLKTYKYKCDCKEHEFTSIRHNKAQKYLKENLFYKCKLCKGNLILNEKGN